ncbi:hypothetical protein ACHAXA_009082 [Cyclostephanos tholiformis]|uniref:CS domain-containing protein n=1 Tax=Cyclostephanos tholiformis TaxID=382380 RepID=A0ABD3SPW2_9STRA
MVDISDAMEEEDLPPPTLSRSQERLDDADEIEAALKHVTRPSARLHLEGIIAKLRREGEALRRISSSDLGFSSSSPPPSSSFPPPTVEDVKAAGLAPYEPPVPVPKTAPAPNTVVTSSNVKYRNFPTHLFDAGGYNSPIVTIYVPLDGIGKHDRSKIKCDFTNGSFDLIVTDFGGANYRLLNDNLEKEIDVTKSKYIVKPNKIIIKLGKVKSGTGTYSSYDSWTQLTSKKAKDKNVKRSKDDPMGGIMDMMKDMYDEGDDNMKKIIGEAMYKQRMGQKPDDMMGGMGMDDL